MVDATQPGELVARILAGEKKAETELVERYTRGVSIILNRATRDRSVSEDLSQDTFQIVLEKIRRGDIREPERLSGFICSLARNLATDYFRKSRRTQGIRTQGIDETDAANLVPEPGLGQLDRLLREEQAKMIRGLLNELSERDRQILFRFYIAEEDKEQICIDLQLTPLHFNRVLHRARERYRERVQRQKS